MLHEDSDHNIDKDELGDKDEHHKEEWSNIRINTTVLETLLGGIALLSQCVLHNTIPVVT